MKWSMSYAFNRKNVNRRAPAGRGLYSFLMAKRIIYIGQAKNIKRRLLQHFDVKRRNIVLGQYMKRGDSFFAFALVEGDVSLLDVEREQIRRHDPPCNVDVKTYTERAEGWKRPLDLCQVLKEWGIDYWPVESEGEMINVRAIALMLSLVDECKGPEQRVKMQRREMIELLIASDVFQEILECAEEKGIHQTWESNLREKLA